MTSLLQKTVRFLWPTAEIKLFSQEDLLVEKAQVESDQESILALFSKEKMSAQEELSRIEKRACELDTLIARAQSVKGKVSRLVEEKRRVLVWKGRQEQLLRQNERPELLAMHARVCAIPRVRRFYCTPDSRLCVETHALYGKHKAGTWHFIGPVSIKFYSPRSPNRPYGSFGGYALVTEVEYASERGESWTAPQVQRRHPCLGSEVSEVLRSAEAKEDYVSAISVLVRFAECFGDASRLGWPLVRRRSVPRWYLETFDS